MDSNDINGYTLGVFKTIYLFLLMNNLPKSADIFKNESNLCREMPETICCKSLLIKKCKCAKNQANQTQNKHHQSACKMETLEGTVEGGPLQYKNDETVIFYVCDHFFQIDDISTGQKKEQKAQTVCQHGPRNISKVAEEDTNQSMFELVKLKSKFGQLQEEHQKLIAVTSELTTALQLNIVGQTKNIHSTLEQCKYIYPSLFPSLTPHVTVDNKQQIIFDENVENVKTIPQNSPEQAIRKDYWAYPEPSETTSPGMELVENLNLQNLNAVSPMRATLTPDTVRQIMETVFERIFESDKNGEAEVYTNMKKQDVARIVDEVLQDISKSPNTYGAGEGKISRPVSNRDNLNYSGDTVINIDYERLKKDLLYGDKDRQTRILQALRWRITKTDNAVREKVINSYLHNDLLDLNSNMSIPEKLICGYSDISVQESICRLINTLASLRQGRDYLTTDDRLLRKVLIKKTKNIRTVSSAVIRNMLVASVQKLSIRKHCRKQMVTEGLFEVLIDYLDEFYDKLSRYCLEYCSALLMNICLVDEAKERAAKIPRKVIDLIKKFISGENECCLPYINGMMFSVLEKDGIVEEAKKRDLDKLLIRFIRITTNDNIRKQLDFIMQSRLFGKSDPLNDNDDENKDEVDLLEIELDQDDFITHLPCGEKLLEEYQVDLNAMDNIHYPSPSKDPPNTAKSFSEENKIFYQKASPDKGIFEGNRPRRFTTFSQVPLQNVATNKRFNFKTGKVPAVPLCYMENCQRYKEDNVPCSCTKCVPSQNRYTCGCYDAIRREVSEGDDNVNGKFGKNVPFNDFGNSKSQNRW
ncbi:uncharacterized protein LOC115888829 isoform X2 [Sitophilus oryzae]|uniref:Uncharacterized protein LOC115888829 isoform X2 n=1 Tax=Sitophilus oryzae TaxID=7048 RepID=A0A6J2YP33_SITOR|nr:uncharacterized protein LOC115888829 isoform X2 [Sitophilus oryzae]